ncbi:MAG: DNA-3-methyladenine glycosylase I, partial [Bryobacteraceae bacterium]
DRLIWQFADDAAGMSKELLRRGFKFVGPTICYAFMQAVGMVDDHAAGCWKYKLWRSRTSN